MPLELAGVATVPLLIGLVEVGKRLGLESRWAAPLAVALGVAISLGYHLAANWPDATAWADALLAGLALGLSAAGLYSGAKKLNE
ncbi:MAG: hypothetical protein HY690_18565 [Chloroflexi bacterium]|nr:hypothetical protein [Chloroflexota bacterium]